MARKIIVVTAAYGNDHVKSLGGQAAVLPFIADAGADGVEIRRELFSAEELNALPALAAAIERHGLLAATPRRRRCSPTTASLTRISRRCSRKRRPLTPCG
jgi:hypothetical protein